MNKKKIRKESLAHLIRESDRYQAAHESKMLPILMKVQDEHDILLSDWDIENMIKEAEKEGRIAKLVKGKAGSKMLEAKVTNVPFVKSTTMATS